jgi:predicted NUDIX family NTP pyrophosphohydrolase
MVAAIDLDGTLCTYREGAPAEIGPVLDGWVEELQELRDNGWKIVLWSVRPASLDIALKLEAQGVPFDYFNENPHGPKDGSNKIYADVYVDDKGWRFMGDPKGIAKAIMSFQAWHKAPPYEPKE